MPRFALLALVLLGFVAAASGAPTAARQTTPVAGASGAADDFAGLVDIGGGRRLWLECRGSGGPTVILEAGYRSPASVWTDDLLQPDPAPSPKMVFEGVSRFTRVCAYERPGVAAVLDGHLVPSRSDPVPMPRTAESVVSDLHALLRAAGVPGPYVLVGHSFGGLLVRLYAATYPDEVVGMVLVDAYSEQVPSLLTPAEWASYQRVISAVSPEVDGYPDYETFDFGAASAAMAAAAAAHPLGDIPLVVLAHGQPFGLTEDELGFSPERLEEVWRAAQEGLARLTPDARFEVATESAHYIQLQQPGLVIDAVRQVVDAVRDPTPWVETAASPAAAPPATPTT